MVPESTGSRAQRSPSEGDGGSAGAGAAVTREFQAIIGPCFASGDRNISQGPATLTGMRSNGCCHYGLRPLRPFPAYAHIHWPVLLGNGSVRAVPRYGSARRARTPRGVSPSGLDLELHVVPKRVPSAIGWSGPGIQPFRTARSAVSKACSAAALSPWSATVSMNRASCASSRARRRRLRLAPAACAVFRVALPLEQSRANEQLPGWELFDSSLMAFE
jgi:hypothetical protein